MAKDASRTKTIPKPIRAPPIAGKGVRHISDLLSPRVLVDETQYEDIVNDSETVSPMASPKRKGSNEALDKKYFEAGEV